LVNARCKPTLAEEEALYAQGYHLIAGIDEVGRGCLIGPVVAGAVIMPQNISTKWTSKVRDSKQLSPKVREELFPFITESAVSYGVGSIANDIIDSIGIAKATCLAMIDAIKQLTPQPDFLLIDFLKLDVRIPQKGIIDGDALCFSIACASIIAKVTRDRYMTELDNIYPGYGFAHHKGYGTKSHLIALRNNGPCPLHRRSFSPVSDIIKELHLL
jgi:ribonuclease HII